MKQKARIKREQFRLHKQLQRASQEPEKHRAKLEAILQNPVATIHQKNRAEELLATLGPPLIAVDELLKKYEEKPQVTADPTPAPLRLDAVKPVEPATSPDKPPEEPPYRKYERALEERAKQEREEFQRQQAEYQRDWDRGWDRW